jgi:hypothetical protein
VYHRRCRGLCRRSRPAWLAACRAGRRQSFPQPRPLSLELHAASTVAPLLFQTVQYYTTAARCFFGWFRLFSPTAPTAPIAARFAPPSRKPLPLPVPPHRSPAVTNGCSQPNARSRVLCPGFLELSELLPARLRSGGALRQYARTALRSATRAPAAIRLVRPRTVG